MVFDNFLFGVRDEFCFGVLDKCLRFFFFFFLSLCNFIAHFPFCTGKGLGFALGWRQQINYVSSTKMEYYRVFWRWPRDKWKQWVAFVDARYIKYIYYFSVFHPLFPSVSFYYPWWKMHVGKFSVYRMFTLFP